MDINKIGSTFPKDLGRFDFADYDARCRLNHFLIKERGTPLIHRQTAQCLPHSILEAYEFFNDVPDLENKYCYLTLDSGYVQPNQTLRDPGWHIDGFQGVEVRNEYPPDDILIWSNNTPTEYVQQPIDFAGFDKSKHNIFNWISKRIINQPQRMRSEHLYHMDSYCIHRASTTTEITLRRFIRMCMTYVPVTSKKMTINGAIKNYDYPVHTTTGEIPSHLI